MTTLNVIIGSPSDSLDTNDVERIREAFSKDWMPPQTKNQFLKEIAQDIDVKEFPVAFELDKIRFAISNQMEALIRNKDKEKMETKLDEVLMRLQTSLPKKNWTKGKIGELNKVNPGRTLRQILSDRRVIGYIITGLIGVTIAIVYATLLR